MRQILLTCYFPKEYIQKLDLLVGMGYYPNRSEAIRMAVRDLIRELELHEEKRR